MHSNNQEQINWHTEQSAVENHEENTAREPQTALQHSS